jgi:hypothetical protein
MHPRQWAEKRRGLQKRQKQNQEQPLKRKNRDNYLLRLLKRRINKQ